LSNITYATVQEPGESTDSIAQSVRSLKHNMDLLTGQLKGASVGAPQLFYQIDTPSTSHTGDLWINTSTNKMTFWNGKAWTSITV